MIASTEMVDVDSRIYEVLNPNDHPSRMMSEGSNTVQRSRTVGASPSKVVQTGFTHYAVPRYISCVYMYVNDSFFGKSF